NLRHQAAKRWQEEPQNQRDDICDDGDVNGPIVGKVNLRGNAECEKRFKARKVLQWAEEYSLQDNDETILAVTRDGEMSLPLL
uniref:hypothetical protein n=1 Tax=Escherichia coli TaxID=562 RepID=UPI0019551AA9